MIRRIKPNEPQSCHRFKLRLRLLPLSVFSDWFFFFSSVFFNWQNPHRLVEIRRSVRLIKAAAEFSSRLCKACLITPTRELLGVQGSRVGERNRCLHSFVPPELTWCFHCKQGCLELLEWSDTIRAVTVQTRVSSDFTGNDLFFSAVLSSAQTTETCWFEWEFSLWAKLKQHTLTFLRSGSKMPDEKWRL